MRIEHSPNAVPVIELPHPLPIPCPEPYVPPDHSANRILALAGFTPDQYQIDETIPYWFSDRVRASNRITESDEARDYGMDARAAYAVRTGETWTISQGGLSHLLSGKFVGSPREGAFAEPVLAAMGAKDKIPELQRELAEEQSAWEDAYRTRLQQFIRNLQRFPAYRSLSPSTQDALSRILSTTEGVPHFDEKQLREEWSNAERLNAQVEHNEILTNWGGKFRTTGSTNRADFWVVQADGTLRNPDRIAYKRRTTDEGEKFWNRVEPEELALSWGKSYTAGPHDFFIAKPAVHGNSEQQQITVQHLLRTIADEWDGHVGMSGNASPSVGKGWDFSLPQTPQPSPTPHQILQNEIPAPKSIEELRALRAAEAIRSAQAAQKAEALQQAQDTASADLLRRRREEFTPETREELKQQHETLRVYFDLCSKLPAETDARRTFVAETKKYQIDQLYRDDIASFQGAEETKKQFASVLTRLKDLSQRKKIADDSPNLWEKLSHRVEQWRSIPRLVHDAALRHGDVTLLLGESVDDVELTEALISKRVARRFLEDPWHLTAEDSLKKEVQELFMII